MVTIRNIEILKIPNGFKQSSEDKGNQKTLAHIQ